jgi:predicted DNA-binding transcriptional regulator YafY
VRDGRPVRFAYRRPSSEQAETRTLEPWGIVSWRGRWYVIGHDRDRAATRVFRLSRITGDVAVFGRAGEVVRPEGVDLRAEVAALAASPVRGKATVRLREGAGGFLRRGAHAVSPGEGGWDVVEVPYADLWQLAEELAGLGTSAVALEPRELRDAVVAHLQGAAGEGSR